MANFSTHMIGAAVTGVVATSVLAATDLLPVNAVPAGIGMVALGGIFPDVDSDYSDSIELVFGLLGVTLGIPVMIAVLPHYGLLLSLAALGLTYVLVRYVSIWFFRTVTVHRGVFHSLPMAVAVTCLVATITHLAMGMSTIQSWTFATLVHGGLPHPPRARRDVRRGPRQPRPEEVVRFGAQGLREEARDELRRAVSGDGRHHRIRTSARRVDRRDAGTGAAAAARARFESQDCGMRLPEPCAAPDQPGEAGEYRNGEDQHWGAPQRGLFDFPDHPTRGRVP